MPQQELRRKKKILELVVAKEWRTVKNVAINPDEVKILLPNDDAISRFKENHIEIDNHEICGCKCLLGHTIINRDSLMDYDEWVKIESSCPDKEQFPWYIINFDISI